MTSLASGSLPAYTLVWRSGWAEWLPASRVAELAVAVGATRAEAPVEPPRTDAGNMPPDPPIELYRYYRRAAQHGFGPEPETLTGALRARDALSTIVDEPSAPATGTLRPPGAVPPPPRAMPAIPRAPRIKQDTLEELRSSVSTPMPDFLRAEESSPLSERVARLRANSPQAAASVADRSGEAMHEEPRAPVIARRHRTWIIGGAAAASALGVGLFVASSMRSGDVDQADAASGAASGIVPPGVASRAATRDTMRCRVPVAARQLSRAIAPNVPVITTAERTRERIAVGFAASRTSALGITIDPRDLSHDVVLTRRVRDAAGVVPLTAREPVRFAFDEGGGALRNARTIDADPPFRIAFRDGGLVRLEKPEPADAEQITDLRVATVTGLGHVVTFRRGGKDGNIVVGWLDSQGRASGELGRIDANAKFAGMPTVATSAQRVLVTFAARSDDAAPWQLRAATASAPTLPSAASTLELPPGGPGGSAISPTAAAIDRDHWLLQWTEGQKGAYQVRAQVFTAALAPVGEPLTLSPPEANAGQGAVSLKGSRGVSVFLVSTGSRHELWGAAIECGG
jgi:hypothetical protein